MKKIAVIGATGMAGSAIVKEAIKRGYDVTAISRTQANLEKLANDVGNGTNVNIIVKDAFTLTKNDLDQYDVIIDAFACAPNQAYLHVDLATKLIAMFRETDSPRLFFILGAGSLHTGSDDHLVVKDMMKDPKNDSFIEVPKNQLSEYKFLQTVNNVNWVGVSPSATFKPGNKTDFKLGNNNILTNDQGVSETTSGTMAVAIMNEVDNPKHHQERFTVVND